MGLNKDKASENILEEKNIDFFKNKEEVKTVTNEKKVRFYEIGLIEIILVLLATIMITMIAALASIPKAHEQLQEKVKMVNITKNNENLVTATKNMVLSQLSSEQITSQLFSDPFDPKDIAIRIRENSKTHEKICSINFDNQDVHYFGSGNEPGVACNDALQVLIKDIKK